MQDATPFLSAVPRKASSLLKKNYRAIEINFSNYQILSVTDRVHATIIFPFGAKRDKDAPKSKTLNLINSIRLRHIYYHVNYP